MASTGRRLEGSPHWRASASSYKSSTSSNCPSRPRGDHRSLLLLIFGLSQHPVLLLPAAIQQSSHVKFLVFKSPRLASIFKAGFQLKSVLFTYYWLYPVKSNLHKSRKFGTQNPAQPLPSTRDKYIVLYIYYRFYYIK
ncbi:hypothetical protein mRhiFer1_009833 [Rhinolophus ferrumequinum]|uniref:Uncharacterized protein n=1 Tax=Rhinolophus ferrumequinum TaxID=59479 RepID=A0A7J7YSC3_RHIFE|nr:hypothetical protein mRhiFer1_009833 [Rhinolophus ferrumequinum]